MVQYGEFSPREQCSSALVFWSIQLCALDTLILLSIVLIIPSHWSMCARVSAVISAVHSGTLHWNSHQYDIQHYWKVTEHRICHPLFFKKSHGLKHHPEFSLNLGAQRVSVRLELNFKHNASCQRNMTCTRLNQRRISKTLQTKEHVLVWSVIHKGMFAMLLPVRASCTI